MLNSLLDEDPQMEHGPNYVLIQDEPTNPNSSTLSVEVPDTITEGEDWRNNLEEAISYRQSFMALPFAMQIFVAISIFILVAISIVFGVIPGLFYFVNTLIIIPVRILPPEYWPFILSVLFFWVLVWKALCALVNTKCPALGRLPFKRIRRMSMMCVYVVLTYINNFNPGGRPNMSQGGNFNFLDDGNMMDLYLYAFFLSCMLPCVLVGLSSLVVWVLEDKLNLDDFCGDEDEDEGEGEETLTISNEEHVVPSGSLLQRAKDGQSNFSREYYVGIAGLLLLACTFVLIMLVAHIGVYILLYRIVSVQNHST